MRRKTRSPETSRRWRLAATSGVGTIRLAAVPRLMATLGRGGHVEEGAASRGNSLQRNNVVLHEVGRQLRVVKVDGVLLTVGEEPVEVVDERGALGLVGLILVEHQPTVAADWGAGPAGGVDDRELGRVDREELAGRRGRTVGAGDDEAAIMVLERRLGHIGLEDRGGLAGARWRG